ncbi:MAG TPA: PLP-dependent aminotransferase family protein [Acidimicrobiales bacterium]|nr:PLP-dependent aminotransferase family protein [Acidimicrobiales bacterium]
MMGSRATSGVEVQLDLAGPRVRSGLEHELREAVRQGRLAPGTRLPSSRTLARDLGIGRNTVADAFGQLVAEGWFVARHGAGTWVADRTLDGPEAAPATDGAEPAEEAPRARFDLRPGLPDLAGFPRAEWLAAARRALAVAPDEALGYGDPRGLAVLREALAGYLVRARRVAASPGRIVVCAGFTQALELLGAVLRDRGAARVAVEAYGHRLHRDILATCGLATVPVPVDERGAVVSQLDGGVGGVLLTPAHQFPLGVALDPARRRQVVGWAAHSGSLVVEDDYDGEFRYDRQAVGALQSLAPDQVVYAGTAAKSLAPGLRLAWLVLPAGLVDEVVEARQRRGLFPSAVDQLTLAELVVSGGFDRHVRRSRLAYRRRRDRLLAALARHAPQVEVSGIAAGLHALAHLPAAGPTEAEIVARAAEHGLSLEGLGAFTDPGAGDVHQRGPAPADALVIGYGTPPDHAYTATLARLTAVLSP